MKTLTRILLLALAGIAALVVPVQADATWQGWQRDYDALVVFGDSLSDPGNKFATIGETNDGVWEVIPDEPYEGGRFTNGITWAEHLARGLRNYRGGLPAYRKPWFGNYAYAGARAQGMGGDVPSFGDQVQKYLARTGGTANPNALYVVQFGGNDIRDALTAAQVVLLTGGTLDEANAAAGAVIGTALQSIGYNIGLLQAAGAQNILVANAPNLGRVPAILALGASAQAEALSVGFNFGLDGIIAQFAAAGVSMHRLDLFSFVDAATSMPLGFGFVDASEPCLQVFTPPATGVCDDADQRLFWDGIHPTRAGHRIVGSIALNVLSLD